MFWRQEDLTCSHMLYAVPVWACYAATETKCRAWFSSCFQAFLSPSPPLVVLALAVSQIETIKRTVQCIERVQLLRSDVHLTLLLLTQKFNTPSFSFIRFLFQTKTGELHRTDLAAVWSDSHSSLFRKSLVFSFLYESVKFPLWDQDQALILVKSLSISSLFILIFHQFCFPTSSCKRVVQDFTRDSSCSNMSSRQHQDRNDGPITFYKSGHVCV